MEGTEGRGFSHFWSIKQDELKYKSYKKVQTLILSTMFVLRKATGYQYQKLNVLYHWKYSAFNYNSVNELVQIALNSFDFHRREMMIYTS